MKCPNCPAKFQRERQGEHKCPNGVTKFFSKASEKQQHDTVNEYHDSGMTMKEFCRAKDILPDRFKRWVANRASRDEKLKGKGELVRSKNSGKKKPEKRKITPAMHRKLENLVRTCRGPPPDDHTWSSEPHKQLYWLNVPEEEALYHEGHRTFLRYRNYIYVNVSSKFIGFQCWCTAVFQNKIKFSCFSAPGLGGMSGDTFLGRSQRCHPEKFVPTCCAVVWGQQYHPPETDGTGSR